MQKVLAALNEEFAALYGVRLTVRTGVNTGEVVANTDENATRTSPPATPSTSPPDSSRTPRPNEVLIGEVTYALVRDYVEVERVELTLKGKPEPVPAYRLIDVRAEPVAAGGAAAAPFVGRDAEMDILRGAFAEIVGDAARPAS